MNLRLKFFWTLLSSLSIILILYTGFQLYQCYRETTELWDNFNSEEIGTDRVFQRQVSSLEANLEQRENARFVTDQIPTDLSNVVVLDGLDFAFSSSSRRIIVNQIVQTIGGPAMANIQYRGQFYNVIQGDSIAGGVITSLSTKELVFEKNDQTIIFSMDPLFE